VPPDMLDARAADLITWAPEQARRMRSATRCYHPCVWKATQPNGFTGASHWCNIRVIEWDSSSHRDVRAPCAASQAAVGKRWSLVLLDAPCSGTGVLSKRADLRWRRTPESLEQLQQLQVCVCVCGGVC
jgi:hypothetical protein